MIGFGISSAMMMIDLRRKQAQTKIRARLALTQAHQKSGVLTLPVQSPLQEAFDEQE